MFPSAAEIQQRSMKYAEEKLPSALLTHVRESIEANIGTRFCRISGLTPLDAYHLEYLLKCYGYSVCRLTKNNEQPIKIEISWSD